MEIRGIAGKPGLGQVQPTASVRPAPGEPAPAVGPDGDEVQISSAGRYLEQYKTLAGVRSDKVAAARESIQSGTMDTDARLSVAIDRLLDDLLGNR